MALEHFFQGGPLHEFHGVVQLPGLALVGVVHSHGVGVAQADGDAHLTQEAAGEVGVAGEGGLDYLEGDLAQGLPCGVELRGAVHHAHRPFA